MKFTLDQIRTIIAEEIKTVLSEGRWDDDPNMRMGYANKGKYRADDDRERDWLDNADLPFSGGSGSGPSEDPNEDKDWEVGTFFHVVEKFLNDRGYDFTLDDIDHKHVAELNAAMSKDDESHKDLMDAIKWSHKYTKPGWALTASPEMFKNHMALLNKEDRGLSWFKHRVAMLS